MLLLAAAAVQPQTPAAFVRQLYANYRNPAFSPFERPSRIFTPRLVAAIAEDARLSRNDVGYIDGDPFCQCQDAGGLSARISSLRESDARHAQVTVAITLPDRKAMPLRLALLKTVSGWRVADIAAPDEASFLRGLDRSNRKQRLRR